MTATTISGEYPHWMATRRRQQCRDGHQQRHRDAIGAGQRVRSAEADHGPERRGGEQPVHQRHIDLADGVAGGVLDVHARQKAELDRLLGQGKHARNDRLRRNHGGNRRNCDQRILHPVGRELIEGIVDRARIGDQQRRLPKVIQHQRRQRNGEPGEPDRHPPEMAHVGVHRFTAGDRQEGRAEDGEADVEILVDQEVERVERTERGQHRRGLDNAVDAERGENDEPADHHRPEDLPDDSGALLLHEEQADQDDDGHGHHDRRQRRRIDLEALDRAQHRDRRRDRAVAVEQGGADEPDDQQLRPPRSGPGVARRQQRQQRDDAAFAAIVGAHDQECIFDRDDQDQRPQDQRRHPEDSLRRDRSAMSGGLGRFLQRIERAGADVAIDDPEGADRCRDRQAGGFD